MTFRSSRMAAIVGCLVIALLVAGTAAALHARTASRYNTSWSLDQKDAYWQGRIRAVGPVAAYREFAQDVAQLSPQMQHANAHVFGGALYEAQGLSGLTTCDSQFSFGCFHEFLGRAIASLGLSVVDRLNQDCVDALGGGSLSCQHGIGHGIMADLGYSTSDLGKALSICKDLPYNDPIGGCYGGVFMEYNLQTMLGDQGRIRKTTPDLFAPCDSVGDPYASSCYFWQPQWWRQEMRVRGVTNNDDAYAKIGALCSEVPENYLRNCFEGIGNNIPADANFDGDTARQLCIDATLNAQDQLYCRSLAADSLFVGGAGKTGDSMALCQGLTGSSLDYCKAYATNKANIAAPATPGAEITGQ